MSLIKDAINKSEDNEESADSDLNRSDRETDKSFPESILSGLPERYRIATLLIASLFVFLFSALGGAGIVLLLFRFWM